MDAGSTDLLGGKHITFQATEPGYVYGQPAVFIHRGRPWRITITGTAMALEGGSPDQYIPQSRIEIRDAQKPTAWVSIAGGPMLQNPGGEADKWIQIEFRILVEISDAPGHYQGDVVLEWMLQPKPGQPPPGGSIPLQLHLDIEGVMTLTADYSVIYFHIGRSSPGGGNYEMEKALDFHLESNMTAGNYFGLQVPQGASFDDLRKLTGTIDWQGEDASDLTIPVDWQLRWNDGTGWSEWQAPTEGAPSGADEALYWLIPAGLFGKADMQLRCDFEAEPVQPSARHSLELTIFLAPAL